MLRIQIDSRRIVNITQLVLEVPTPFVTWKNATQYADIEHSNSIALHFYLYDVTDKMSLIDHGRLLYLPH